MGRRVLAGVDPKFKEIAERLAKENNMSQREITRRLADEISGETLLGNIRNKEDDDEKKKFKIL